MYILRQFPAIYKAVFAWVNQYVVVCQYFLRHVPAWENAPVVGSYYKCETMFWIVVFKSRQSIVSIRWARHGKFEVRHEQVGNTLYCQSCQLQPLVIWKQGPVLFKWIAWADHQPKLINQPLAAYFLRQKYMSKMYWIERSSEQAYPHSIGLSYGYRCCLVWRSKRLWCRSASFCRLRMRQ